MSHNYPQNFLMGHGPIRGNASGLTHCRKCGAKTWLTQDNTYHPWVYETFAGYTYVEECKPVEDRRHKNAQTK